MICKKCKVEFGSDGFYGRDKTCKECRKAGVRANRRNKIEQYRDYEKSRASLPHRVEQRKRYSKTDKGRAAHSRACKKYIESNALKRAAHIIVGNALRDGVISKGLCEVCGSNDVHGHHDDYREPLKVRWLCPKHHQEWHDKHGPGLV